MAKKTASANQTQEEVTRKHALKLTERLRFSSEFLPEPDRNYLAWIDLMGAGHLMATSLDKAANAIVRIHLAVFLAVEQHGYQVQLVGINDGIFICSPSKKEIMRIVRSAMMYLAALFISKHDPQNRFLARCAIAFGPTFTGRHLTAQLSHKRRRNPPGTTDQVIFGPPVIQAYRAEQNAPPFGVAIHESARAFAAPKDSPFKSTLWKWWQTDDSGGFSKATPGRPGPLKDVLFVELDRYFDYMEATLPFHGLTLERVERWRSLAKSYFVGYSGVKNR